jgi:hypothetical protein
MKEECCKDCIHKFNKLFDKCRPIVFIKEGQKIEQKCVFYTQKEKEDEGKRSSD